MNKELTTVIVRALLQAVAGALTARGVVVENGALELVSGGLVAALSIVWSVKEKARIKSDTITITKP